MSLSWEDIELTGKGDSSRRTGHAPGIRSLAHATVRIRGRRGDAAAGQPVTYCKFSRTLSKVVVDRPSALAVVRASGRQQEDAEPRPRWPAPVTAAPPPMTPAHWSRRTAEWYA